MRLTFFTIMDDGTPSRERLEQVRNLLESSLGLSPGTIPCSPDTVLLGALAELDSMGVVTFLTTAEEYFGISFDDEYVSAATFSDLLSLGRFIESQAVK